MRDATNSPPPFDSGLRFPQDTTPPVDVEAWWAATAKVTRERDDALAALESTIDGMDTKIERLTDEHRKAGKSWDAFRRQLTFEAQTKDDAIERLNTTIRRVNHLLDARWGSSAELDDLIDDIHSTIAGAP